MKQVLQSLSTGETTLLDCPVPQAKPGHLVIASSVSLVSAGTERMLRDFGKASWLQKARKQPEKVKMVLNKLKTDGLFSTIDAIKGKLETPIPLGYSNVGTVIAVGTGCEGFSVGDRVVSNGPHAEAVVVPKNLCAKIPDNVSDEEAAFTVLGAIALQGIRLAAPTMGERFVVMGLGLIGQLTTELLLANGCSVLAMDYNEQRCQLAKEWGAQTLDLSTVKDPLSTAEAFSQGEGVDGVLITAATQSDAPVHHAAQMCRKRGRIVLVGVTGLKLSRSDFYEKELSFQVSCSYGPGRYENAYEKEGLDYPIGFVRWTENRNFQAVLQQMSQNRLHTKQLVSHRFPIEDVTDAYDALDTETDVLGVLLQYPQPEESAIAMPSRIELAPSSSTTDIRVGLVGAGNYANRTLTPLLKKANCELHTLVSQSGVNASLLAKKTGFRVAASDNSAVFDEAEVNTVFITTQHDSHAELAVQAIESGKHVWIEKPLALTEEGLERIHDAYRDAVCEERAPKMTVGFNRRFAPMVQKMKSLLEVSKSPKTFIVTVNAGHLPASHWTQDPKRGGGRIIGEACHFIDLLRFLSGASIQDFHAMRLGDAAVAEVKSDKVTISLAFQNGDIGTIHYFANGSSSFPKERIEVFSQGAVLQCDNYRALKGFGWPGFKKMTSFKQDKGQGQLITEFFAAIRGEKPMPIPFNELIEVSRASIQIAAQVS